jgi:phosphoglycerate dehydrogenase-like enzyme
MRDQTAGDRPGDGAARPAVAVLLPAAMRRQILSPAAERQLASFARVVEPAGPAVAERELPELLAGAVACLTGWGTPPLADELLLGCPELRLVAHTAGSIRRLVPPAALERGLRVSHAAAIIADAVAELVVAQALLCLRRLHEIDRAMRAGDAWAAIREAYPGRLLGDRTVGVVGAGRTGRAVIQLLRAFGCRLLAYDPHLTPDEAARLGVAAVGLDELCAAADVVTLHAPVLPETRGMIGRAQLARLREGAVFINAARASLVDEGALLAELRAGRIVAALDVFGAEPLPPDSPFRALPNVILSPHTAGHTLDTHLRQGQAMVEEVGRLLRGEPLRYEVTPAMLPIIA